MYRRSGEYLYIGSVEEVLSFLWMRALCYFFRDNVVDRGGGAEWLRPEHEARAPSAYFTRCVVSLHADSRAV